MKESDMRKVMICTAIAALTLIISGCTPAEKQTAKAGPAKGLSLNYEVGQTGTYKLISESWKVAKFEGPELSKEPKLKSGRTGRALQMTYTQEITAVNPDGSAAAKITVKSLKFDSESSSEVTNAIDSEKKPGESLAKLVCSTYTIKLYPDGRAEADDMTNLRGAITEGAARDMVTVLFSDKEIARLHSVNALPESPKQKVGAKWSKIEASPKEMMDAKNFEKIYTLTSMKDGVATIDMKAVPSTKPAEKGEVNSQAMMMAMFAPMMESKDNYTGKLVIASGSIRNYNETLDAQWFARDPQAKPDKEPDTITIGYIQKHTIEKVN